MAADLSVGVVAAGARCPYSSAFARWFLNSSMLAPRRDNYTLNCRAGMRKSPHAGPRGYHRRTCRCVTALTGRLQWRRRCLPSLARHGGESIDGEHNVMANDVHEPPNPRAGLADVVNHDVGLDVLVGCRDARHALGEIAVAAPIPRGQPRFQQVARSRHMYDGDGGVRLPRRFDHGPRHVAHDGLAQPDIGVDRARDAVAEPVRLPPERKGGGCDRTPEHLVRDGVVILERCRGARDDTTGEDDGRIIRALRARAGDQRILAGAARADHQDQAARPDLVGRRREKVPRAGEPAHATRLPRSQVVRTIGTAPATWTRIRSARLPTAIAPRSVSPTASAGVLLTVRTAAARSMPGATVGSRSAAINRLAGM